MLGGFQLGNSLLQVFRRNTARLVYAESGVFGQCRIGLAVGWVNGKGDFWLLRVSRPRPRSHPHRPAPELTPSNDEHGVKACQGDPQVLVLDQPDFADLRLARPENAGEQLPDQVAILCLTAGRIP